MESLINTVPYFSIEKPLYKDSGAKIAQQRTLGAYYTPKSAADFMANWAIRRDGEHIVEPSFGDGSFLKAIANLAHQKNLVNIQLTGIEINAQALAHSSLLYPSMDISLYLGDFLGFDPTPTQAIIGNPPYVRLRNLPADQQQRALLATQAVGHKMDPAGSLWMPFVLHACRFLTPGGRLALVLPYDFTYVRYARPLWDYLSQHFGNLRLVRTHERLFPDIYQEVVLLLADGFGRSCNTVCFDAFKTIDNLIDGQPVVREHVSVRDIIAGKRVFLEALLSPDLRRLLAGSLATNLTAARQQITFNIGYVSGDKNFFHPSQETVAAYGLPDTSLYPAIISARMLKNVGLNTANLALEKSANLFLPDINTITKGEQAYILQGESQDVSKRYKCRIRQPWYVVPGVRIPDFILSVFSERPLLLRNDARYVASNSLLCGYCIPDTSDNLIAAWYTSLTLLQCELEVHSLGGGVMVIVPGEAGSIRLPRMVQAMPNHLAILDQHLQSGHVEDAYAVGDYAVLESQLGLTPDEIALIREGVKTLSYWRTSSRSELLPIE